MVRMHDMEIFGCYRSHEWTVLRKAEIDCGLVVAPFLYPITYLSDNLISDIRKVHYSVQEPSF